MKRIPLTRKNIIIGVIGLVLVAAVAMQITHVASTNKKTQDAKKAASRPRKSVANLKMADQKSMACDTVTAAEVGGILKAAVERRAGFLGDRTKPYLFSACSYATKVDAGKPTRSVTVTIRELASNDAAHKSVENLRKNGKGVEVKGLGDESYYVASSNQQLTRKGKRLILVIVNKPQAGQPDSKTVSAAVTKLAL